MFQTSADESDNQNSSSSSGSSGSNGTTVNSSGGTTATTGGSSSRAKCGVCGKEFGRVSIKFHEPQCQRKAQAMKERREREAR